MTKIRVVIADDHIFAVEGLHKIIAEVAEDDMKLVGETTDVNAVIPLVKATQPDVLVLDMTWLGDKTAGLQMIPEIIETSPKTQVIAITVYPELLELAQQVGAHALGKGFSIDDLLRAIRWAAYPKKEQLNYPVLDHRKLEPLTEREREVLKKMAQGSQDREIASSLGISVGTVKKHVSNILSKLGANNRTEAANIAIQYQLTSVSDR